MLDLTRIPSVIQQVALPMMESKGLVRLHQPEQAFLRFSRREYGGREAD